MKKFISLVLALTICLSCGAFAFAADNTYNDVEEIVVTELTPRYREVVVTTKATILWKHLPYSVVDNIPLLYLQPGTELNFLDLKKDIYGNFWYYASKLYNGGMWYGYVSNSDAKLVIG